MSIMSMFKRCPNCKRQFTYNPSVGDMGLVCPHCNKTVVKYAVGESKNVINTINKIFEKSK